MFGKKKVTEPSAALLIQMGLYRGVDDKAREAHPAAVAELTAEELAKRFEKVPDEQRSAKIRAFLSERVTPRDAYGRRRVFDVAHHTHANRAQRRAVAKSRGVRTAPGFNKPFERA